MAHIERTGRSLVAYFGATRDIATITRLEAAEWRLSLSRAPDHPKGGGRAPGPHVVSRHVVWAKLIFRVAHELDLIPFSPMDRLKIGSPATEQHWRYVSVEEAEKLIAAAPSPTWTATFALARYAGLRRNEIEAFKWSDMDRLAAGRLLIHGDLDIRTTKRRTRECPISPRLREVLAQAHADMPHTAGPWEGGMDRNSDRVIHAIVRAATVAPYDKPLHTLRKSLETDWIDQHEIADVCQWLGNSPAVALKHYHRARPESFARVSQG
jgi:integrase